MNAKLPIDYKYQAFIKTEWLGMTDHNPSRIKATNLTSGESVTVSWDYALDVISNHLSVAQALYKKLGLDIPAKFIVCGTKNEKGYILTSQGE